MRVRALGSRGESKLMIEVERGGWFYEQVRLRNAKGKGTEDSMVRGTGCCFRGTEW